MAAAAAAAAAAASGFVAIKNNEKLTEKNRVLVAKTLVELEKI